VRPENRVWQREYARGVTVPAAYAGKGDWACQRKTCEDYCTAESQCPRLQARPVHVYRAARQWISDEACHG